VVVEVVLVIEGAQDVGGQHREADGQQSQVEDRQERHRREHLPHVPGTGLLGGVGDDLAGMEEGGLHQAAQSPEGHPPGVQAAHAVVHRQDPEEGGRDHHQRHQGGDHAHPPVVADGHVDPEGQGEQGHVLFHEEHQPDGDQKAPPSALDHEPQGEQDDDGLEGVRVELLEVGERHRRVEQVDDGQDGGHALRAELLPGQEEHRHRRPAEGRRLGEEQDLGRG